MRPLLIALIALFLSVHSIGHAADSLRDGDIIFQTSKSGQSLNVMGAGMTIDLARKRMGNEKRGQHGVSNRVGLHDLKALLTIVREAKDWMAAHTLKR